jgi:hypothetical protein
LPLGLLPGLLLNWAAQRAANFRRSIEGKLLQYKTWRAEKSSHRSIRTSRAAMRRKATPSPLLFSPDLCFVRVAPKRRGKILIAEI